MVLLSDIEGDALLPELENIWCVCFEDLITGKQWDFTPDNMSQLTTFLAEEDVTELVFHNGIGYDLPALEKVLKIPYEVEPDSILGLEVIHTDTLLLSKLLNPDRNGGHSLGAWGERLGNRKSVFNDFTRFTPEMLKYCQQDVRVLKAVYIELMKEMGSAT